MFHCFKKTFSALKYGVLPILTFACYAVLFVLFIQKISFVDDILIFGLMFFIFCTISNLFFPGWLMWIKNISLGIPIDKQCRESFGYGIKKYTTPLLFGFLMFILLFVVLNLAEIAIADKFIGKIDFLFNGALDPAKNSIDTLLGNLTQDQMDCILKREIFFIICAFLLQCSFMYAIPALYNQEDRPSAFLAIKKSFLSFLTKPFTTMVMTLIINVLSLLFLSFLHLVKMNGFFVLGYFIITSAFVTFIIVLLFCYYEKYFTDNCNNGADSIGQE